MEARRAWCPVPQRPPPPPTTLSLPPSRPRHRPRDLPWGVAPVTAKEEPCCPQPCHSSLPSILKAYAHTSPGDLDCTVITWNTLVFLSITRSSMFLFVGLAKRLVLIERPKQTFFNPILRKHYIACVMCQSLFKAAYMNQPVESS